MSAAAASLTRVLVVTGGHPYEPEPFFQVFEDDATISWSHIPQPAAAGVLAADELDADVVVLYDMPGIRFTRSDPPIELLDPPEGFIEGFTRRLRRGVGIVACHHAIAGWPAWDRYAELLGGRFHYTGGQLGGREYPDSGYRFDVTHTVEVLDPEHPICAGLGASFTLTDELYFFPVLEDRVVPLLRTTFDTSDISAFSSADLAVRGQRGSNDGWNHPPGSRLVGWVTNAERSPLAYLQFGDGPVTYADPVFRRVLSNAIGWAASSDAHAWAKARHKERVP